jgi:hypothetical protein
VSDTDGVVARFTNDIWPAINAYNGVVAAQGGRADRQFHAIIDPSLRSADDVDTLTAYASLRDAVQGLGQASRDSVMSGNPFRDPRVGLRLGSAVLTALNPPVATLKVCYTYSLIDHDHAMPPQPAASEITVKLHKTDAWYLHSITNNHVVPSCPASTAGQ